MIKNSSQRGQLLCQLLLDIFSNDVSVLFYACKAHLITLSRVAV